MIDSLNVGVATGVVLSHLVDLDLRTN